LSLSALFIFQNALILWTSAASPSARLRSSDHFLGLQLMGSHNSLEKLTSSVEQLKEGVTEYMVSRLE
jgi:hypothetical protein